MIKSKRNKWLKLSLSSILVSILAITIISTGCENETAKPPATVSSDIGETLVPNIDLDIYVYVKQDDPTEVPGHLIGSSSSVAVQSLALWGIPTEDNIIWGGGLTFVETSDASRLFSRVSNQSDIWTSLAEHTIYFIQGSGDIADQMKKAISNNDFKRSPHLAECPSQLHNTDHAERMVYGILIIHVGNNMILRLCK